jgi:hypothetical protein
MSDVTNTAPGHFVGWRRVAGGPWRPVAEGGSAFECLDRVLAAAAESGRSGESVVLPAGQHPGGRAVKSPGVPAGSGGLFGTAHGPAGGMGGPELPRTTEG